VSEADIDPRLIQRLAAQGVRPVEVADGVLLAECIACRTHWEIAGSRLGLPTEDEEADWWWCPNGCNRAE
jgi:hypothetical protein